jgi:ABC-2 type transport system permease protein
VTSSAAAGPGRFTSAGRYRHSLWLLTKRDLQVRYTTNALGYLWSIIDPLLMSAIYFLVFGLIFHRSEGSGTEPFIVFLISGMLPWVWFNGAISEATRGYLRDSKLIRSTRIPRTIWVNRIVLSKGIEYLASLPVLAVFVVLFHAPTSWNVLVYYPAAILLQAVLTTGMAYIVAPLVIFFRDLERAIKLILRLLFYASAIVYSPKMLFDSPHVPQTAKTLMELNPLGGILALYRAPFFPHSLDWKLVVISVIGAATAFLIGVVVFARTERSVLKEI